MVAQIKSLDPRECLKTLKAFWREHTRAQRTRTGVALTLPLMFPDGWQVSVLLESLAPGYVRISDYGRTIGALMEVGLTLNAKITGELLEERLSQFEVSRDGYLLFKDLRLPLQGLDIQLFGEALVSISHLSYRHEPSHSSETVADEAVRQLLSSRKIAARRNVELQGALEQHIRVDYLVERERPLAIEVVNRRYDLLPYMEQWAFRWDDLRKNNRKLSAAMVYDPEKQEWDSTALRIGADVCDVFCRYDETQALDSALLGEIRSTGHITNIMSEKKIYIERRKEGDYAIRKSGSERASDVRPTQKEAIERARELVPDAKPHVERVRHTDKGSPDKWRKA